MIYDPSVFVVLVCFKRGCVLVPTANRKPHVASLPELGSGFELLTTHKRLAPHRWPTMQVRARNLCEPGPSFAEYTYMYSVGWEYLVEAGVGSH